MAGRNSGSARRRSVDGARPKKRTDATAERAGANNSSEQTPSTFEFECPLCGNAKGKANTSSRTGEWVISCWSCTQGSYLFDLAETLEVKGGGYQLKADPYPYLEPHITSEGSRSVEPAPRPRDKDVGDWKQMLHEDKDVEDYLYGRGLSPEIIAKANLGYDGQAITIPIRDLHTREWLTFKRRFWPKLPTGRDGKPQKYEIQKGSRATLYPGLVPGQLILCEGEFDALMLWQHKLPGVSATAGMTTKWNPEWNQLVTGRRIYVIYDAEPRAEDQAISRASELRAAGADATPVLLSKAGMSNKEDISDWFVVQGRSRVELERFCTSQRRRKKVAR